MRRVTVVADPGRTRCLRPSKPLLRRKWAITCDVLPVPSPVLDCIRGFLMQPHEVLDRRPASRQRLRVPVPRSTLRCSPTGATRCPQLDPSLRSAVSSRPERRRRIDALREATQAEIETYERPIRQGTAWPIPPYHAVLIETTDEVEIEPGVRTRVWAVTVPEVPGALTQGRNMTEAVAMARDAVCGVLDTDDWGFELIVKTYPATPHDTCLDE